MSDHSSTSKTENQEIQILAHKDLSVTALYTAHCWYFAKFQYAEFFISDQSKAVFDATNFAMKIASAFRRDLIDLPQGLAQRHLLIDRLLDEILVHTTNAPVCVIEVACGLSQRGSDFRVNRQVDYYEIDLPHVIEHKKVCIEKLNQSLKDQDQDQSFSNRNFSNQSEQFLISADLKDQWTFLDQIKSNLSQKYGDSVEYLLIAEGLWMYLDEKAQRDFLNQIRDFDKITLIFDLVPKIEQPKPGMIGRLLGQLMRKFTKDSFVENLQTRENLVQILKDFGFSEIQLFDCHLVAKTYQLPFADTKTQQLIFKAKRTSNKNA
jgi:O-methyltransferase involved in polyketide biosynthesis